ncbi:MAG: ABC1 kinase family protein [Magnetospiraceae bacterium]
MSEQDRFSGRVKRYAKVGTAVGGLAARLASERVFGIDVDRDRMARDLKQALGGLKGPLMKVAQIMSTIPDMLPEEYVHQFTELQTNAPAMGWPFVKRRMATELGNDWQTRFAKFDHAASAAASLGQVHKAVHHDGWNLACKLQYPDMRSAVEADLKQLKLAFSVYRRYDKAINPEDIHAELSARLREELDYRREAKHQRLYRHMLSGEDNVHVSEVIGDLSTERLLTTVWLTGTPLMGFKEADVEMRNQVAINMFRAWYVPFYLHGVLHGDPHLGNYTVREDGSVNLMDFGCIRIFPPSFVKGVIDLYRALEAGDEELAVHAYETWGFQNLSKETIAVLNIWAEFLYGPILEDRSRPIDETNAPMYGAEVAARVQKELRRVGGVKPPREFVLMDRAAIGLGSVFLHLKAEINWYRLFHELVADFDVDALTARQGNALKEVGLDA